MFVPFDTLPASARIWIYKADRKFSKEEENMITAEAHLFCEQWTAHGHPLKTSFTIEDQLFLILSVDESEAGASGCSIDGSVRMLKHLQRELSINFLDRTTIPFLIENEVRLIPVNQLKESFGSGVLSATTLSFNTLIGRKAELENEWKIPAGKTWLSKYLPKSAVA